jgi:chemotaxis protein methyltransferase CheR
VSSSSVAPVVSYLEETLGLSFSGPRRARLLASIEGERVAARLSPEAFVATASRRGAVFDRLVAQVTVGETYFFRDRQQCELLRHVVFPQLAASTAPGRQISMWSAGCASGDETFTLAALADDAGLAERSSIVGSDVCRASLDKAETGVYGRWSLRSTTDAELAACFQEQDGIFRVDERLRRRVTFVQRNLLDGPPPPGRFDVVLCRNLLIYLTPEGISRAAAVLATALTDDGWLLTAAGDPPLAAAGLAPVRTPFGLAYRRAGAAAASPGAAAARASWSAPGPAPGSRRTPPDEVSAGPARGRATAAPAGSPPAVRRPVSEAQSPMAQTPMAQASVARVRSLGDAGRLAVACAAAEDAVGVHPLDVELRYLAGALLLEAGRLQEASVAAAAAVYLAPNSPAAQVLLGQVQRAAGQPDRARRSFRNALRLLAVTSSEMPVALAVGVPAGHLAAIAQHHLDTLPAPA